MVLPAQAGVILCRIQLINHWYRTPRVSGDDPERGAGRKAALSYSLRKRGWSLWVRLQMESKSIPRVSEGDPCYCRVDFSSSEYSPRKRVWSPALLAYDDNFFCGLAIEKSKKGLFNIPGKSVLVPSGACHQKNGGVNWNIVERNISFGMNALVEVLSIK